MALITSSEYGLVAVNNSVLCKLIIDDMLSMGTELVPCNKKGKPLRKGFFTGYNEFYNSVELSDDPDGIKVKVYFVLQADCSPEETSDKLFNMIEADFATLCLDAPVRQTANIKGTVRDRSVDLSNQEVVRTHDR